jgi:hypothetical protein
VAARVPPRFDPRCGAATFAAPSPFARALFRAGAFIV